MKGPIWFKEPRGKAYLKVVRLIIDNMINGTLKPGYRLISERDIAQKLDISRNAVREGLKTLEYIGIVEMRDGQGAVVGEVGRQSLTDILTLILVEEQSGLLDIVEVRKIMESGGAELAAINRTVEDLCNIQRYVLAMNLAREIDAEQLAEYDISFHRAVMQASHNPLLVQLWETISDLLSDHMKLIRKKLMRTTEEINSEHRRIYSAIEESNELMSRQAALDHISSTLSQIAKEQTFSTDIIVMKGG